MKFFNECYPCILRQAINTATLLELRDSQIQTVINEAMEYLLQKGQEVMPMHSIVWINKFIHNTFFNSTEAFDPFKKLKYNSNLLALQRINKLEDMVSNSSSPLETALHIAAVGNTIDFGAKEQESVDINHEIDTMGNVNFGIYHYNNLFEKLCNAKKLLYIGDNAGEIVFDKVFIREIKKEFSAIDITFAVRERPIINDATIEDARFVGLDKEVLVISGGSFYPGTILEETNEEFRELFTSADVKIAKGQGNFESLNETKTESLFFIFRVKCNHIAGIIGAKNGELVLYENDTLS